MTRPLKTLIAVSVALATAMCPLFATSQTAYEFKNYKQGLIVTSPGALPESPPVVPPIAEPALELSTSAVDFGDVITGATESNQVLVTNKGTAALSFTSAPATSGADSFSATTGCSVPLAPLESCLTTIQFSPTERGAAVGTLAFNTNAPSSPHRVTLTGRGTGAQFAAYSTDGSSLVSALSSFENTPVGTTSNALTFQVRNVGNLSGTPLLSSSPSEFSVTGCGAPLAPGFTCTASVTFTPATTAPLAGVVQIAGATSGGILNVDVSGTGAAVSASNWSLSANLGRENWYGMAFGAGKFLTIGSQGHVYTSTDGAAWTKTATANTNLATARDTFYLNGRFVVLSVVGGYTRFMSSSDGTNWTGPSLSATSWNGAAHGNGKYVAVDGQGNVAYSSDGSTFGMKSIGGNWYRVAFGAGRFLAVSNSPSGTLASSVDGVTWTTVPNPLISTAAYGGEIAFVNGRFLLVQGNSLAVSTDGTSWTTRALPLTFNTNPHIAYGGGTYVILARSNKLVTSSDALSWTAGSVPTAEWHGVAYGNGRFAAGTYNGYNLGYSN